VKDLPKNSRPNDVIDIWEKHKTMLNEFASADIDGLPPNTTGTLPQWVNLQELEADYYVLGHMLMTRSAMR